MTRGIVMCAALLLLLLLGACAEDDPVRPHGDGGTSSSDSEVKNDVGLQPQWAVTTIDAERAGKHASLAAAGGNKYGLAYFRELLEDVTVTCPASGTTPGGPKARPAQDLMYVAFDGSSWGTPAKIDQTIGPTQGVSLAIQKSSGKAFVGYLGGAMSLTECYSSDAVIASSTGGASWSKRTVQDTGIRGDTVGYWMSVALDSKGVDHAAYRDVGFGYYEQDGADKATAVYDTGSIVENIGAGLFTSLVFDASDKPVVAFVNSKAKDVNGGTQVAIKKSGWERHQVSPVVPKERISLATDGKGTFGLAYYEPGGKRLRYSESTDLQTWKEVAVDTSLTNHGLYGSLAFDSKGNPGVSYYKCGKYSAADCDPAADGLKFAYRKNGTWKAYDVDSGDNYACGMYTSLAFDENDQPVIAYQCVGLNNQTNEFVGVLKVARGVMP